MRNSMKWILLAILIAILSLWVIVWQRDAGSADNDSPNVVYKYLGPETIPVSGCFITDDQFLICRLGE